MSLSSLPPPRNFEIYDGEMHTWGGWGVGEGAEVAVGVVGAGGGGYGSGGVVMGEKLLGKFLSVIIRRKRFQPETFRDRGVVCFNFTRVLPPARVN